MDFASIKLFQNDFGEVLLNEKYNLLKGTLFKQLSFPL